MREVATTCRLCESECGLLATVDGDRIGLRPDPDHPVSRGHACAKGIRFPAIHAHRDRILRPRVDGAEVGWDVATREIGSRLRAIGEAHGPGSVGLYLGNAAGRSLGAILGGAVLGGALGAKTYSCLTLDNSGMFVVTEQVLGDPLATFVADYGRSDCILLIGTDPLASQPSQAQSNPAGVRELLAAPQLIVVDPRRSATARRGVHYQPRPGTDLALLAYLVREVLRRRPQDQPELAAAVEPWDLARAEAETGMTGIAGIADRLLTAERPLVWSGLGVLLGPEGTLGYWLTLALQAVLGGIGRPGGWLRQPGAVDLGPILRRVGPRGWDPRLRSRIGGYPAVLGTLAAATLADDVLVDGPDRLRALVVVGGNPAVSLPDTAKARRALEALDLLVVVDLFANETARTAHAVLPAADWLERADVGLHMASQRRIPHLQVAPAVVPPRGEAREDWDILTGLARAAAPWSPVAAVTRWLTPTRIAAGVVRALAPFPWAKLAAAPRGLVGPTVDVVPRMRLAPPMFTEALAKVRPATGALRLVTSVRPTNGLNTWIRPSGPTIARMNPYDLVGLGEHVTLTGPAGSLTVRVGPDVTVARGAVVLPFGDARCNPNVLVGTERLERFTGQPLSNGEAVTATAGYPAGPEAE